MSAANEATMNGAAPETMSDVRKAALAMGPLIREQADEIERGRRLTPAVVEAMKQGGIFGMAMPRAWGGAELDPLEQLRVIEILSRFDGSVGWCTFIGAAGGHWSSWLGQDVARELFGDVNAAFAASVLFAGKAHRVDKGYLVTGRWPFASGCQHSECFALTCRIIDNDGNGSTLPNGAPAMRMIYVSSSKGRILDTWYSTGLRGSGSHDVELNDVFVPEAHSVGFPDCFIDPPRRSGPIYAFPLLAGYLLPGVALGVARAAIDAFIDIASHREITVAALGGQRALLRTSPHAQVAISRAEGLVRSARSHVFEVIGEIWEALVQGDSLSSDLRASYQVANTNAHRSCTEAVDLLYKSNGGSSVYARGPLDRCFRDIHTISQHNATSLAMDEKAGQVLLGLEPADHMF
jgi:alkylation response protein AidB-like acyl-CoA dehydrogenase